MVLSRVIVFEEMFHRKGRALSERAHSFARKLADRNIFPMANRGIVVATQGSALRGHPGLVYYAPLGLANDLKDSSILTINAST